MPVLICIHFKGFDATKKCNACGESYLGIQLSKAKPVPDHAPEPCGYCNAGFPDHPFQGVDWQQECTSCGVEFGNHELPTNMNEFCDLAQYCIICEKSFAAYQAENRNFKRELAEYQRIVKDGIRDYEEESDKRSFLRCRQQLFKPVSFANTNTHTNAHNNSNAEAWSLVQSHINAQTRIPSPTTSLRKEKNVQFGYNQVAHNRTNSDWFWDEEDQ